MHRRHKLAALCAIGLALTGLTVSVSGNGRAYASSLAEEQSTLSQLQKQADHTYAQISAERHHASTLKDSISEYQASLSTVKTAIAQNQQQTATVIAKIQKLDAEIQADQAKLDADKDDLQGQLRVMYEEGRVQYMAVLFSATSFNDLVSRLSMLEQVTRQQNTLLQEVRELQQSVESQKQNQQSEYTVLRQKQAQLQSFKEAQQILQQKAETALSQVNDTISQTATRQNVLESQIQLTQSQITEIKEETARAQELEEQSSYVSQQRTQLANVSASPVISYAEQFMGVPYVWGGTQPSGFDCSGFVQYVFSHFGVGINRTSEEQFAEGVPVDQSNLQPGDLVFFSTYAPGATHVGLYMGGGMMIDAEDRGVTVDSVFNSYWGPKYIGARQILNS